MKPIAYACFMALGLFIFISCQRELYFEKEDTINSTGSIKKLSGECMPSEVKGTFKKGQPLDSSNYIHVDIDVLHVGSYQLVSDSVNGMYFKGAGAFEGSGIQTVRLDAFGTPITNGTVPFHIRFNKDTCIVNVFIAIQ